MVTGGWVRVEITGHVLTGEGSRLLQSRGWRKQLLLNTFSHKAFYSMMADMHLCTLDLEEDVIYFFPNVTKLIKGREADSKIISLEKCSF